MAFNTFAVIILGHGSRVAAANGPLQEVAAMVSEKLTGTLVIPAFLQLAEPSLEDAVARLVAGGVSAIAIHPFFLYPGAHVTEDVPAKAEELRRAHPGVHITVTDHLGVHPLLADLVVERVRRGAERLGEKT